MIKVVIIIIIMFLTCFAGILIMGNKKQVSNHVTEVNNATYLETGQAGGMIQMIALAETREEAEEIAVLYGITLIDYSYNVATYETEKDPRQLMKMGKEKGYPAIEINHQMSLF